MNDEQVLARLENIAEVSENNTHFATLCLNVGRLLVKLPPSQQRSNMLQQQLSIRSSYAELNDAVVAEAKKEQTENTTEGA